MWPPQSGVAPVVTSHTLSNTASDRVFNAVNYVFLTVMLLAVAYPLYFMAIASFSDPHLVNNGKLWLFPKGVTFEGYRRIFSDSRIWTAYLNTTIYTLGGVSVNLLVTIPAAYALSRRDLWGRNLVMVLFTFTLLFGGGLIPTYLIIRSLGVLNTRWVMIIPNAVAVWNLIIARTFFQTTVPPDLLDASRMDGASNLRFFVSVVIPISPAIIAVLALFYGVGHWNAFFEALIYLKDPELYPLQLVLRSILIMNESAAEMMESSDPDTVAEQQRIIEVIKYGLIMVASVPVLLLYPFLQKYFVKGVMIGALKG